VVVEGRHNRGILEVTKTAMDRDLLGPGVRQFSIEAYVERTGSGLRLGSGLEVAGTAPAALPSGSYAAAVLTAVLDRRGRLGLQKVSLEGPPTRSGSSSQAPGAGRGAGMPASTDKRNAAPTDRDPGPARSRSNGSRPDTAHGRGESSGNSGNSRGGSNGAGGGSGNAGGNAGGHGSDGNSGGNGGGHGGGNNGGGGNGNGNGNGGGGGGGRR
jgi:hypothetical protein